MGLDNPLHIAVLLLIVLLVFGAKRLPEMGRSIGHGLRGFKEAINPQEHASIEETAPTATHVLAVTEAPVSVQKPVGSQADADYHCLTCVHRSRPTQVNEMRARSAFRVALASVTHDHQMSFVDHLDEFRTRMIVVLAVVGTAFAVCFWQNHALLRLINAPLSHATLRQARAGEGVDRR